MSAVRDPEPGPLDPVAVDALLGVLAQHARELRDLGPVRLGAGGVSLEVGAGPTETPAPPAPALAAVPAPSPEPVAEPVPDDRPGADVCSTTVGVFYRAAEPGKAPFVVEGDTVTVGQQIGIVEAMKLMIPLESDRAGVVTVFLVEDGASVEHGQPVLRVSSE